MQVKTTKSGLEHDLMSVDVTGSLYHTTISKHFTVHDRGKHFSLSMTRDETLALCAALLSVLSDTKEEDAITQQMRTGNITKRYPRRKVYSDQSKRKLKSHQMHERDALEDATHYRRGVDVVTGEDMFILYNLKGERVGKLPYSTTLPDACLGLIKIEW